MTYGRVRASVQVHKPCRRGRKSLAELVRGELLSLGKAPSSGPSGHLLPKGRRGAYGTLCSSTAAAEHAAGSLFSDSLDVARILSGRTRS